MSARANPFATCHLETIPFRFPAGMGWDTLLKRLEELNWCASLVGGNGVGKTTLIEQIIPHLEARGFQPVLFRLQTESGMKEKDRLAEKLREVKKPGFILLDGAEQLSTRQWLSIRGAASEAAGFIVTVHRTSRLPVALELETSPRLIKGSSSRSPAAHSPMAKPRRSSTATAQISATVCGSCMIAGRGSLSWYDQSVRHGEIGRGRLLSEMPAASVPA